jgi:hypothetical protein
MKIIIKTIKGEAFSVEVEPAQKVAIQIKNRLAK